MSAAHEIRYETETGVTLAETHDLVAWFGSDERRMTEPVPALGMITRARLGNLLGDEPEFDFLDTIAKLSEVEDEDMRQATYLYICGYCDEDLELMTGVAAGDIASVVDAWKPQGMPPVSPLQLEPNPNVVDLDQEALKPEVFPILVGAIFAHSLSSQQIEYLPQLGDAQVERFLDHLKEILRDRHTDPDSVDRRIGRLGLLLQGYTVKTAAEMSHVSVPGFRASLVGSMPSVFFERSEAVQNAFVDATGVASEEWGDIVTLPLVVPGPVRRSIPKYEKRPITPNWAAEAACRSVKDVRIFYPTYTSGRSNNEAKNRPAKIICRGCPVIDDCREDALANGDFEGIRGGLAAYELKSEARARRAVARRQRDM